MANASAPLYMSRRRVEDGEWTMTLTVDGDAGTITIPAGTYYHDDDATASSLVKTIDSLLEAEYGAENFATAFDPLTGKITLEVTSALAGTWECTFNQDSLALWCGWGITGGWAATATKVQTSEEVCQGLIYALSGRSKYPGRRRHFSARQRATLAGDTATIAAGVINIETSWSHENELERFQSSPVLASGTWDEAFDEAEEDIGTVNPWCWQDFFEHHCAAAQAGEPFRVYVTPAIAAADIGKFQGPYILTSVDAFAPGMGDEESTYWWVVQLTLRKAT